MCILQACGICFRKAITRLHINCISLASHRKLLPSYGSCFRYMILQIIYISLQNLFITKRGGNTHYYIPASKVTIIQWYRTDALTYMFLNNSLLYILSQLLTHIYLNYWLMFSIIGLWSQLLTFPVIEILCYVIYKSIIEIISQ